MQLEISSEPINLREYEDAARALLTRMAFDYIAGGAQDESTLRANREAFGRWVLLPRVLRGVGTPDLHTTVLGRQIDLPILLAPVAFHRLAHEHGETASARAAGQAGTIFIASTASTFALEEVAPHAGAWWFQLYFLRDRELTRDLVRRAEEAGAEALVVTVDTPVLGRREADERNHFALPEGVQWANLLDTRYALMSRIPEGSSLTSYFGDGIENTLSWRDLEWLASITSLPVIPKGIVHPEDARIAVESGAGAIVVSNHGGRQLDGGIASLDALPAVVDAVSGKAEVLIDGGVRRGSDVIKALALGAKAVLIGRPYIWGLAHAGEAGARRVLDLLAAELTRDLILCGCASVAEIDASLVVPAIRG